MPARRAIALAAVAATLVGAGAAQAQAPPLALTAEATETGWVTVHVAGAPGTRVTLAEAGQPLRTVTVRADGTALVQHLSPWRCDATTRTITAAGGGATAAATVTTPPCTDRFTLRAPRTARAGRAATVRVTDRWRVGGAKDGRLPADAGTRRRVRVGDARRAVARAAAVARPLRGRDDHAHRAVDATAERRAAGPRPRGLPARARGGRLDDAGPRHHAGRPPVRRRSPQRRARQHGDHEAGAAELARAGAPAGARAAPGRDRGLPRRQRRLRPSQAGRRPGALLLAGLGRRLRRAGPVDDGGVLAGGRRPRVLAHPARSHGARRSRRSSRR